MPNTPAPALLSEERLAEIANQLGDLVEHEKAGHVRPATGFDWSDCAVDLLADRTAFRQAVAEQLRGLLVPTRPLSGCFNAVRQAEQGIRLQHNARIHAAAKALNLDL